MTPLLSEVVWPHFWAVQLWLVALIFVYCSLRELVRAIGRDKVVEMFLARPARKARRPGVT